MPVGAYGLALDFECCPDGVHIVDHGPPRTGPTLAQAPRAGRWFEYRSGRREKRRRELNDLEDVLAARFANANSEERQIKFFGRFGLSDWRGALSVEDTTERVAWMAALMVTASSPDYGRARDELAKAIAFSASRAFVPELPYVGRKEGVLFTTSSMSAFMVMECATAAQLDCRFCACGHCGALFFTGSLTHRRSHAKYCADPCRVAAMRARNRS